MSTVFTAQDSLTGRYPNAFPTMPQATRAINEAFERLKLLEDDYEFTSGLEWDGDTAKAKCINHAEGEAFLWTAKILSYDLVPAE